MTWHLLLLCHLPFLVGILLFLTLHLDLTSMSATASYSYEGFVAAANEPYVIVGNIYLE